MNQSMNELIREITHLPSDVRVGLVYGDITLEDVDAIVNAANRELQHGGGVAAAIAERGGPVIQQESDQLAPVETGNAVFTTAGDLPARYVIHAVGPRWGTDVSGENADNVLGHTVKSVLELANVDEWGMESVSIPAISTGIYSFPSERAAGVILNSVRKWLDDHPDTQLKRIRVCIFDRQVLHDFQAKWEEVFPDRG